ncbi:MAG TPA: nucleotidyl transferase AbiEii/AbiGii toxin family protein [Terriglobia bacterium]|nr:nucleotidyl transferase AbiEii/AbiGii toxin family protein [Terriglobia bacterium]
MGSENGHVWHREAVGAPVEEGMRHLQRIQALEGCYLAGGTGLALHLGHRRSMDLYFFSSAAIDEDGLIQKLQNLADFAVLAKAPGTVHAQIGGVKVSFLAYAYELLFALDTFMGVPVADPRKIACMKVSAIASRGTRRDFIDLHAVSVRYGLEQVLRWFTLKFSHAHYNRLHILKSLTYFEDAKQDPMPDMLVPLSWQEVEEYFLREAPALL